MTTILLRLLGTTLTLVTVLTLATGVVSAQTYVDAGCGDDANTGANPDCGGPDGPKLTIQAGIDGGGSSWVIVAPGTYYERVDAAGHRLSGSGGAEVTIIDGTGIAAWAVVYHCNHSGSCGPGVPGFTLEGFTVTGGGLGVLPRNSSTIRDCVVTGNHTGFDFDFFAAQSTIENVIISNNYFGVNCNTVMCEIKNSLISNNVVGLQEKGSLINSTVVGNTWGLIGNDVGEFEITNSIVYGISLDPEEHDFTITNSLIENHDQLCSEVQCVNSSAADPLFVDESLGDYRLSSGSPAIDAGTNDPVDWSTDLDGNPRIVGPAPATVDIGAYEYQAAPEPPVALCREVLASADGNCVAGADVDDGSFDPDGDPITLEQSPPGPYGLGTTLVTLTVTDDQWAFDSCTATVTVEDMTPPGLSVTVNPDTLWPPNHRMVDIEASVIAADNCGTPTIALASLASNEADDAPGVGDGRINGDIQPGADDLHFSLRAERAGTGSGRIYTATYTATDGAENAGSESGFVVVPHDQDGVIEPVAIVLDQSVSGTLVTWAPVPDAESYNVIRGTLNGIAETDVVINLGSVLCIEADSSDESTLGREDDELPEPGEAFFYLVEYYDGSSSTYGTESAGKPRAPGTGGCE